MLGPKFESLFLDCDFLLNFISDHKHMYKKINIYIHKTTKSFQSQHVYLLDFLYVITNSKLTPGLLIFTPAHWILN